MLPLKNYVNIEKQFSSKHPRILQECVSSREQNKPSINNQKRMHFCKTRRRSKSTSCTRSRKKDLRGVTPLSSAESSSKDSQRALKPEETPAADSFGALSGATQDTNNAMSHTPTGLSAEPQQTSLSSNQNTLSSEGHVTKAHKAPTSSSHEELKNVDVAISKQKNQQLENCYEHPQNTGGTENSNQQNSLSFSDTPDPPLQGTTDLQVTSAPLLPAITPENYMKASQNNRLNSPEATISYHKSDTLFGDSGSTLKGWGPAEGHPQRSQGTHVSGQKNTNNSTNIPSKSLQRTTLANQGTTINNHNGGNTATNKQMPSHKPPTSVGSQGKKLPKMRFRKKKSFNGVILMSSDETKQKKDTNGNYI